MASPVEPATLFAVRGMVALITGGGTGIGLMMTRALAHAGAAHVYIVGRRLDVLESAVQYVGAPPGVVVPLQCDVTSKSSLENLVSHLEKEVGYLNLLVCNAGITGPQVRVPPAETTLEEWRRQQLAIGVEEWTKTFHVNATAAWYTTMAFLTLLDQGNKKGNMGIVTSQVIVTSSVAGFNKISTGGWAYGPSKAAATHIAKMLAVALPTWGIRTNCLCPGLFPSEMSAHIIKSVGGSLQEEATIPLAKEMVPVGRMGDATDMAGQILYLASRSGAYCNGTIVVVDGGRLGTCPGTGY